MLRIASYGNRHPAIVLKGIALNVPFYLLTHLFMQYLIRPHRLYFIEELIMEINLEQKGNIIDIKVKGDIEMMTIKEFKEKLLSIGEENDIDITLDLSEVDYIDSSGVGVLISLNKIQKKKGKKLELAKVSPKVLNVLKLSSLAEVFNL